MVGAARQQGPILSVPSFRAWLASRPERFYLVAEVLSESNKAIIESKRDIYRAHTSCTCILLIERDRMEINAELRGSEGWHSQQLLGTEELILQDLGLKCLVREVYRDTSVR